MIKLISKATAVFLTSLLWIEMALSALSVPTGAVGTGAESGAGPVIEARLVVNARAVVPGELVDIGVLFDIESGWHMYWRNPGESGLPTRLDWKVEGADVGPIRWPAPHVFSESEDSLTTYGYSDSVLLQNDALITGAPGTKLKLAVNADFLVCKLLCIPGRISLERSIPVGDKPISADAETHSLFAHWDARVPASPESMGLVVDGLYSQSALRPGDEFRAAIALVCDPANANSAACSGLRPHSGELSERFVADDLPSLDLSVTGSRMHPFSDGVLITLSGLVEAGKLPEEPAVRGVGRLENGRGETLFMEIDLPLPMAEAGSQVLPLNNPWLEPQVEQSFAPPVSLWQALLLALLGGLILNLMPCVLPVLAIKVFGIAERAHSDRSALLTNGAAYAIGILTTMAGLAALVIALRAAGTSVGWGFQFQEPLFVASISALLLAFALNLFGVFEVGVPGARWLQTGSTSQSHGFRASFFEGLLAVLLATPCTAPFLGTAVGFAFASSAPMIVGIFLAIGIGLALPFVMISLVPGWARLVPRSGSWMNHLRTGLGFALLGTLVWLLWVVGQQVGTQGMSLLLAFLFVLSVGAWIYGARQRNSEDGRAPLAAGAILVITIAALAWLPLEPSNQNEVSTREESSEEVDRFEPAAVAKTVANGRPAFVYFTADWCLTCKLNEKMVLADQRILRALEERNVATFKADWTLRDETIRAELARFGRAGVPMYLLYAPHRPERPTVLPELLSVDLMLDALDTVKTPEAGAS